MDLGSLVRRLVPGAGSSRAGDRSATTGTGAPGGVASPPVPITAGEWRSLPPIQRTVGDAPLVAPSAPFKAGLAAAGPAPIALAPLGHERHLAAPAGLAIGIATPVQRAPAEPVPTSVRRRGGAHRGPAIATSGAIRWPDADTEAHSAETPAGESPVPEVPVPGGVGESPAGVTVTPRPVERSSLVAAPSAAPRPTGLVGTAAVARSFPVAQRSAEVPDSALRDTPVGLPAGPVPSVAVETSPGPSGGISAPIVGSGPPLVPRRLRLGPPVRSPASAGPVAAQPPGSAAAPGRPTVARAAGATPGVSSEVGSAAAGASAAGASAAGSSAAGASAGPAAVQPSVAGPTLPAARETTATADLPPVVLRTAAPARRPSLPLVGGLRASVNPGRPAVVPRTAASDPVAGPAGEPGSPSAALAALARVDPYGGPFAVPGERPRCRGARVWGRGLVRALRRQAHRIRTRIGSTGFGRHRVLRDADGIPVHRRAGRCAGGRRAPAHLGEPVAPDRHPRVRPRSWRDAGRPRTDAAVVGRRPQGRAAGRVTHSRRPVRAAATGAPRGTRDPAAGHGGGQPVRAGGGRAGPRA